MAMQRRRFLFLSAAALAPVRARSEAVHQWQGRAMGAGVTLLLRGASDRQARGFFDQARRHLAHAESQFSLHRDSDLTRLNRLGWLRFPAPAMRDLLALCDRLHRATGGAFDPTVQPIWLARAQGQDEAGARALTGWSWVRIRDGEIRLARPGMALTLNGIAQGWVADRLALAAAQNDLGDVMIDSGEQRAIGAQGWPVGIADPQGRILRRLVLRERALATSSPRGTLIGHARPHIIDPRGNNEALAGTVSVSAPSAALADGLSTALCLLPRRKADQVASALPGCRIEAWQSGPETPESYL